MYIPIILGTARSGRQSEKAARFMLKEVESYGLNTELLDVKDYRIGATDNTGEIPAAQKLKPVISKADGIIIVAPEYNHGYPGELKMMLDMLYEEFHHKPVGICGVSAGNLGGARMVEALRLCCIEFHMVPIRESVYFSIVQDLFDDKGSIQNKNYHDRIKKFLDELTWYADKLQKVK